LPSHAQPQRADANVNCRIFAGTTYVHPTQPALDAAMLLYGQSAVALEETRRSKATGTFQ
jgi:hypothetical protein